MSDHELEGRDREAHGSRDEALGELAARVVHIARKLTARPHQDQQIIPLSALEALALRHVDRYPGISSTQLATDLELRTSNASTVLRALVEKGMLARTAHPNDRRAVLFSLTEQAHESVARLRAEWSRRLQEALPENVEPDQVLELLTHLDDALT